MSRFFESALNLKRNRLQLIEYFHIIRLYFCCIMKYKSLRY
ncbi:hypothetical protein FM106_24450 [Brachybacterium faecium]|nr:hypothetical protein FM106_24450 [Brachybacterium faecium]